MKKPPQWAACVVDGFGLQEVAARLHEVNRVFSALGKITWRAQKLKIGALVCPAARQRFDVVKVVSAFGD